MRTTRSSYRLLEYFNAPVQEVITSVRPLSFAPWIIALLFLVGGAAPAKDYSTPRPSSWAPPDIDQIPVHESPCAMGDVLSHASQRVQDLVVNMQRFSASEEVAFEEVDRKGVLQLTNRATFSYVADIREAAPHQLMVEEYRNDSVALRQFPSKFATLGTAAFALIFHPDYVKDFEVICEGLSEWQGRRAWRLHLRQSRVNNFRYYTVAGRSYPVMLKARAWIDAETFEVLRLETDLRDPIPQIPLLLEHVIVDYALVEFPRRDLRLWLPRSADIYMDCRRHQYHHRHTFSHFQLFWVDTQQTVKAPPVPPSEPSYLPQNASEPVLQPTRNQGESASKQQGPIPTAQLSVTPTGRGDTEAEFRQGLIYHIDRKYADAAERYLKAAEQGHPMAQNNLAVLYAEGQGVAQDYVAAHMWFTIAGAAKPDKNRSNLQSLESHMSPEQIADAQRRAEEWLKQHPALH